MPKENKWRNMRIRELYNTGKYTQAEIGENYGISQYHVSRICRHLVHARVRMPWTPRRAYVMWNGVEKKIVYNEWV